MKRLIQFVLLLTFLSPALGQDVSPQYAKYFIHKKDNRSMTERILNAVNLTSQDVGRSFALLANVSKYPNMKVAMDKELPSAGEDIRKLKQYLIKYEFFDEVVVLQDQNVTLDNLQFFLQSYFPERLAQFPKSRFLFAFSGHGMQFDGRGYILQSSATSLDDKRNAINTEILKTYLDEVIEESHHTLVLLNSCFSGAFLKRSFGGTNTIPLNPGAHAITSGGSTEQSFHDPRLGSGSVFFEKLITGLDGIADYNADGIITSSEIMGYLTTEVRIFSEQRQNPQFGDISRNGSTGEFFFFNRSKQLSNANVPVMQREQARPLGEIKVEELIQSGNDLYDDKRYAEAYNVFQEAADMGNAKAMYYLGYMTEKGEAVAANNEDAFIWYRKSAELDYPEALVNAGLFYERGMGVQADPGMAFTFYERAAMLGNGYGMNNLGVCYRDSIGVSKDYDKAFYWIEKAATGGLTLAVVNLGYLYEMGYGVQQNYTKAHDLYLQAANTDDAIAMRLLAQLYREGLGVSKSPSRAFEWYRKAADKGDGQSMSWVGYMLEEGIGTVKNKVEAVQWYYKAANAGEKWSADRIAKLRSELLGVTPE